MYCHLFMVHSVHCHSIVTLLFWIFIHLLTNSHQKHHVCGLSMHACVRSWSSSLARYITSHLWQLHFVYIRVLVLFQKAVVRKKYATRDEDLFSDSTDIFAEISGQHLSQTPASSTKTTDRHLQSPDDDNDGDYECYCEM